MARTHRPQGFGEAFIDVEHETLAAVTPLGGTRTNGRQYKNRRGASKRFPPERDILFICCSRVQPFLPFGEITVLKRQLRQSIRRITTPDNPILAACRPEPRPVETVDVADLFRCTA